MMRLYSSYRKKGSCFKTSVKTALTILILALVFGAGYLFGHKNLVFEENLLPKLVNTEFLKPRAIDFSLYSTVYQKLSELFPEPLDPNKVLYQSIKGLVSATGDPYSAFLDPEETKEFERELSGKLEGIGAEVGIRKGVLTVISPLDGSPAKKAGLRPLDQIIKIDGEETFAMSLDEAVMEIRGKPGTTVTLTIIRRGEDGEKEFKIVRQKINVSDFEWKQINGVVYLRVRQFGEETENKTEEIAEKIKASHSKGLVLDLRDNPGGLLSAAVKFTSLFLPKDKTVVREKSKGDKEELYKVLDDPKLPDLPVVVLINEGSASAAEIVAGALKENGRAKILGEKTFGKGSVQSYETLPHQTSLKVTVARWLTPKGRDIEGQGIKPDIEVAFDEAETVDQKDPQLDKALELLSP